jgi:ubiquinone/menaquinone biosynthesis C-methylase UbiE/uncharacterized protein YbaR (Trm112 family)
MTFVCPICKGPLSKSAGAFGCEPCQRDFPVVCGIPDFRLWPDPYIAMREDRQKGEHLANAARTRSFEALLNHYYDITEEDPPDLAEKWTAHSLAEVTIAHFALEESGMLGELEGARLLDVGCSTGGLLISAAESADELVGVDVAFRWLVVGQARLREAEVSATLVCANAEALPFEDTRFDAVTAQDVIEHLREAATALVEIRRVSATDAPAFYTTNNRYAPIVEPHIRMWGVGYLPRAWQAPYVAWRREDLHRYSIRLRSAAEINRLVRNAGYAIVKTQPAPLFAPHRDTPILRWVFAAFNWLRKLPLIGGLAALVGPRLCILARR